jgi:DNA-binding cell septation regulator SpoVG
VRLRRVNSEGRMKAIASITIDNEFVVHDIRVIDGNNGMFVAEQADSGRGVSRYRSPDIIRHAREDSSGRPGRV